MELIPKAAASSPWASVSTFPNTMPGWASEAFSKMGPNMRQGPHHEAQKSTSTVPLPAMVASSCRGEFHRGHGGQVSSRRRQLAGAYNFVTVTDYSRSQAPDWGSGALDTVGPQSRRTRKRECNGRYEDRHGPLPGASEEGRRRPREGAGRHLHALPEDHKYHWNVTGPMFQTLHVMFETHYTELALVVDEIAERIRALGGSCRAATASSGR